MDLLLLLSLCALFLGCTGLLLVKGLAAGARWDVQLLPWGEGHSFLVACMAFQGISFLIIVLSIFQGLQIA